MKYVVEFSGTFFLVLTIGLAGVPQGGMLAPLAIGSMLMVMVYAGGHISGAHYNPAVTLAVFIRGRCPLKDLVPYWAMQVAGAIGAAVLVGHLRGLPAKPNPEREWDWLISAMIVEFVFTFAL